MLSSGVSATFYASDSFRKDYGALVRKYFRNEYYALSPASTQEEQIDLAALLNCATIFSTCLEDDNLSHIYKATALRIITTLMKLYPAFVEDNQGIVYYCLAQIGNFPIAKYLFGEESLDFIEDRLPIVQYMEAHTMRSANMHVLGEKKIFLTDFQADLVASLESDQYVVLSAPTSSGKSFVLVRYLIERYHRDKDFSAVYIVPTKTLIAEISSSIRRMYVAEYGENINVLRVATPLKQAGHTQAIYVLTQERFGNLLDATFSDTIKVVIVDEAQAISDQRRGEVLRHCLLRAISKNPTLEVVFGATQLTNPEEFGKIFSLPHVKVCGSRLSPVSQNLVRAKRVARKPGVYRLAAICDGVELNIGEYSTKTGRDGERTDNSILAKFCIDFGSKSQNLVYSASPRSCISIAKEIAKEMEKSEQFYNEDYVNQISEFVKGYIHEEFSLSETILNGVGIHFGRLPSMLTSMLEEGFNNGSFPVLVSTSTLLHGVNLPARNLFLCNPKKKRDTVLSPLEFWNLAGRAGRLGRDTQGNIFLIERHANPEENWSDKYINNDKRQPVTTVLSSVIQESRTFDLLKHFLIHNRMPENTSKLDYEAVSEVRNSLLRDSRCGRLSATLTRHAQFLDESDSVQLEQLVQRAANGITVPAELLEKHPSLAPYQVDELYKYVEQHENQIEDLLPAHPQSSEGWQSLYEIFQKVGFIFGLCIGDQARYHATLAKLWMVGTPFKQLLAEHIRRARIRFENRKDSDEGAKKIKDKEFDVDSSIKDFFDEINDTIMFEYARSMRCYEDILDHFSPRDDKGDIKIKILPIHSYLELGVCEKLQISLISCGLSRITAIEVSPTIELFVGKDADVATVEKLFTTIDRGIFTLPPYIMRELDATFWQR